MALTEDFTFMLGDNGVVLNTDTMSPAFVDVYTVVGLDNAPYRETQRDHEGVDGGFLDAEFEKGRPIVIQGFAYGDTTTDLLAFLDALKANYAPSKVLIPFYYNTTLGERVLFVKPQGCKYDWTQALRTASTPIAFNVFAEDPRQYSSNLQTVTIPWSLGATTGFEFPLEFDFGFGSPSSTDSATFTVGGNRPTPAVITITGPVTNPRVIYETLGKTLFFNISLGVGESLVIDLHYKTVKLNGTANRRGTLLAPNWFYLVNGENTFRYQGDTGSGSVMTIQYRAAWR